MENLFKKFLYTGVGLVASTAEKVQTNINDTVEKQKATESEGEKVVTDLKKDTEAKFNEMEERLRSTLDSALARFNLPNKEEMSALKTRIAELEAELAKKETAVVAEVKKAAPKKTTTRRRTTRKKVDAKTEVTEEK
ncbi:MAG: phasin family protein [Saprospiraceae bacterium]